MSIQISKPFLNTTCDVCYANIKNMDVYRRIRTFMIHDNFTPVLDNLATVCRSDKEHLAIEGKTCICISGIFACREHCGYVIRIINEIHNR